MIEVVFNINKKLSIEIERWRVTPAPGTVTREGADPAGLWPRRLRAAELCANVMCQEVRRHRARPALRRCCERAPNRKAGAPTKHGVSCKVRRAQEAGWGQSNSHQRG
jgi:hypothetical protein